MLVVWFLGSRTTGPQGHRRMKVVHEHSRVEDGNQTQHSKASLDICIESEC